jgi:hypothetical protein
MVFVLILLLGWSISIFGRVCINVRFLRQAVKSQQIVVQTQSRAPSAMQIRTIAENLKESQRFAELKGGIQFFWNQLSGVA